MQEADRGATFVLPAGVVTLLLADMEGSVRAWEADAAVMDAAVAKAEQVVADCVGRHEGVLPLQQGEGDSFVAAFARPTDAVAAALEIQQRLIGSPCSYRMALHTGEAQTRSDGNYMGTTIHRCARLRSLAHGGQILMTDTTAALVVDALPPHTAMRDLGIHRLRDLARAQQVWQLEHPDLHDDFPALASVDTVPNNLPVQLTEFIGRSEELRELTQLIPRQRLTTLTGTGGCGKTRLALQVAAEVARQFPQGVWFVELTSATTPEDVRRAIALTLACDPAAIESHLSRQRTLLVLDNCEQVVEGAARVAESLLRASPEIALLATSRERLDVPGELTWRVPSMAFPERAKRLTVDAVAAYDAIRLFMDRASRSRPGFCVDQGNLEAVVDVCERLGGIPLAIELAAARVRMMSPQEIAAGLADRFRLLTGGSRTLVPRQQTLWASVDWSHELLTPAEQAVFRRLSTFVGPFKLGDAEEVCADVTGDPWRVFDLLSQLVDKSLVVSDTTDSNTTYWLLETVREYGHARLTEADDDVTARRRHAAWAYELIRVGSDQAGFDDVVASERFKTYRANFDVAVEWALEHDPELALALAAATAAFLFFEGRNAEADSWLSRALEGSPTSDNPERVRALIWACHMARITNDLERAAVLGAAALQLARELGNDFAIARAEEALVWLGARRGDDVALDESNLATDKQQLLTEAQAALGAGNVAGALKRLRKIVETADERDARNERWATCTAMLQLAGMSWMREGVASARELALEAARLAKEIGNHATAVSALLQLASLAVHAGQLDEAEALLDEADARSGGRAPGISGTRADIAWARGDHARCDELLAKETSMWWRPFRAQRLRESGNIAAARRELDAYFHEHPASNGWQELEYAEQAAAEGDTATAEMLAHEAIDRSLAIGSVLRVALALELIAKLRAEQDRDEAKLMWAAATAERDRLGVVRLGPAPDIEAVPPPSLDDAVGIARRLRTSRPARATVGWAALTPTEVDVARLVAEHLSNPEIAERLLMSRNTVKSHLAHMFTKLGVTSRSELAEQARAHITTAR